MIPGKGRTRLAQSQPACPRFALELIAQGSQIAAMVHALLRPLLMVLAVLLARPGIAAEPSLTITVAGDGPRVQATIDGCVASLGATAVARTFVYRNTCRQDLQGRVALLARMIEAAAPQPADREPSLSVKVESLAETFPDFAKRLAVSATRAPDWHGGRARVDAEFANTMALRLINGTLMVRELQEAMRRIGLTVRVAEMSNVKVGRLGETPFDDWLASRGVDARRDQVPYDATATFRLTP